MKKIIIMSLVAGMLGMTTMAVAKDVGGDDFEVGASEIWCQAKPSLQPAPKKFGYGPLKSGDYGAWVQALWIPDHTQQLHGKPKPEELERIAKGVFKAMMKVNGVPIDTRTIRCAQDSRDIK